MAFPNLLVGLREGLEAGLVVTILIGAVRRLAPGRSLAGVWLGVAAAAVVSLSFGAVLTFTEAEMSPKAQEVFGGVTSLVTVALVTSMIFWMRRAARGLSGDLRERVGGALAVGGPALIFTAFVAVAREGLEAALFVWTNAQAAGSSTSPLLGAVIGLVLATGICVGLYRRVLKVNLSRLFTVTGSVLVVIVAGVLAYGITDLQDAGVLAGLNAVAFDISAQVPTGTWWSETIRGVTNLNNRMSWLSVIAYVGYLAAVLTLFLRHSPSAAAAPAQPARRAEAVPQDAVAQPAVTVAAQGDARRRGRAVIIIIIIIIGCCHRRQWRWRRNFAAGASLADRGRRGADCGSGGRSRGVGRGRSPAHRVYSCRSCGDGDRYVLRRRLGRPGDGDHGVLGQQPVLSCRRC